MQHEQAAEDVAVRERAAGLSTGDFRVHVMTKRRGGAKRIGADPVVAPGIQENVVEEVPHPSQEGGLARSRDAEITG